MKRHHTRCTTLLALAALATLAAAPLAQAHHSYSMFDRTKEVTVEGVVSDWKWTNPHAWLTVTVPDGKGGSVNWEFEGRSINELTRQGLRSIDIKPGDKITVVGNPAREGQTIASLVRAELASGKRFGVNRDQAGQ